MAKASMRLHSSNTLDSLQYTCAMVTHAGMWELWEFHTHTQYMTGQSMTVQVVAYLEVTPDVMPAKIYVNETAQALRGLMEPFSQMRHPPSSTNCTDLLDRVMIAGMLVHLSADRQGQAFSLTASSFGLRGPHQ